MTKRIPHRKLIVPFNGNKFTHWCPKCGEMHYFSAGAFNDSPIRLVSKVGEPWTFDGVITYPKKNGECRYEIKQNKIFYNVSDDSTGLIMMLMTIPEQYLPKSYR